jgi:hypothetical protein
MMNYKVLTQYQGIAPSFTKKIFLILTLITTLSFSAFSQSWTLLGNAEFTQDATALDMDHHPVTGETYIAYANSTDANKLYVMKYNGSNWVTVGSGAASSIGSSMISLEFNPATNEPWVSYKNGFNGKLDVVRFNAGTSSWIAEGLSINSDVIQYKTELRFSPSGGAYIAYQHIESGNYHRTKIVSNQTGTWVVQHSSFIYTIPRSLDYTSYNKIFYTGIFGWFDESTAIYIVTYNGSTWNVSLNSGVDDVIGQQLAATENNDWVLHTGTADLKNYNWDVAKTSPTSTGTTDLDHIDYDANPVDGLKYLSYISSTGTLETQRFSNGGNSWEILTPVGVNIGTATTKEFEMAIHPSTGYIYLAYMDNGKVSVKTYTVTGPPANFFVDKDATGANDGTSWADAFTDLHDGLAAALAAPLTKEVWVADGTYKPEVSNRTVYFNIGTDVELYGGFDGTETDLSQRDWKNNEVILSGDLQGNDNNNVSFTEATRAENSNRLLYISGENTRIDGITISGGQGNHLSNDALNRGAAIYKATAINTVEIHNCKIENNVANITAGIFAEFNASAAHYINIHNSIFQNNESRYATAYIISFLAGTGNASVANCLLANNIASDLPSGQGFSGSAGFFDSRASTTLNANVINCTIVDNTDIGTHSTVTENAPIAIRRHGGTLNFTATNNIFDNNSAAQSFGRLNNPNCPTVILQNNIRPDAAATWCGGTSTNEISTAPALDSNYRPTNSSPGNNIGDNTAVVGTVDYDNNNRIINGTVDLGAFEYGCGGIPTNAAVDMITPTNALFSWDVVSGATYYQVKYRLRGTTAWSTSGTASTQRSIPNLSDKKYYQFKVRAQCASGSWSDFTAVQLFYTSTCDVPTGVASIYLDNARMRIRWDNNPSEIKAKVRYREVGTPTWYTQNSQPGQNFIYINNLTPNATYQYKVRSNCSGNDWSAYSGLYTHDLSGSSLRLEEEEVALAATKIYPNPTRDILNIEFETKNAEEVNIIISDNLGRTIHALNGTYDEGIQTESIDMNRFANGYYFITIHSGERMETQKLIKMN